MRREGVEVVRALSAREVLEEHDRDVPRVGQVARGLARVVVVPPPPHAVGRPAELLPRRKEVRV